MVTYKVGASACLARDVHIEKYPCSFQVEQFSPLISAFFLFSVHRYQYTGDTNKTDTPRPCLQEILPSSIFPQ